MKDKNSKANAADYDVIRGVVVTEKASLLLEKSNTYVFTVARHANKQDIKRAVERVFDVSVESINTILVKGKRKVFRGRLGKRSDKKKAMVRIKAGNTIDLGTGV
jgi:large subunit ribosomal protein L23